MSHPDNLQPIPTPRTNTVLHGPPGSDVGDLHCELVGDDETFPGQKAVINFSAWDLDERQRELLAAGAHIRLGVWQHPIPPLSVSIEAPFCSCGSGTIYVREEMSFACPACGERMKTGEYVNGDDLMTLNLEVSSGADSAEEQVRRDFRPAGEDDPDDPAADMGPR